MEFIAEDLIRAFGVFAMLGDESNPQEIVDTAREVDVEAIARAADEVGDHNGLMATANFISCVAGMNRGIVTREMIWDVCWSTLQEEKKDD
jgi:hypothetical protein